MSLARRARNFANALRLLFRLAPSLLLLVASGANPEDATDIGRSSVACANVDYGRTRLGVGGDPETTPNPRGPTLVSIGVFVRQLSALDVVQGQYMFRGHVRSTWCDPRLAFDATEAGTDEKVYVATAAERELAGIWYPAGFPVNRAGGLELTERILQVAADGTVHSDLNIGVPLHASFDLRRFPFDRQKLALEVESVRWQIDEMVLVEDEMVTGFSADLSMPEWEIMSVGERIEQADGVRDTRPFSRLLFEIELRRRPGFYLWKVLLPIFIIVAISWSVFWMTDENVASRTRITATGVLTVVAYQFVVAEDLPRIAYLTVLDKLMLLSFGLLAVTVVQSLWVGRLQASDFAKAKRLDRMSRWIFPLGYAVLVATLIVTA